MKTSKKIILGIWGLLFAGVWYYYFQHPELFTKEGFYEFLKQFDVYIIAVYIIFSCLRALFLIPSTVLIFAGAFFLDPIPLFFISMFGIIVSTSIAFYFTEFLDMNKTIESGKDKKKIQKIEESINKNGMIIVTLWALTPIVPTDVIAYVAGMTKMNYFKFITGIIIGETPLVLLYVFAGSGIVDFLKGL